MLLAVTVEGLGPVRVASSYMKLEFEPWIYSNVLNLIRKLQVKLEFEPWIYSNVLNLIRKLQVN